MKKIEIYLQARMGSTRLPGKTLLPIMGRPILYYQLSQLKHISEQAKTVVLTTTSIHDDPIISLCQTLKVDYFRGSKDDVLARYYFAAQKRRPDGIIRITGDCPLIDPELISQMIQAYRENEKNYDLVSNVIKRTFPRGEDIEIFSFEALEKAFNESEDLGEREHVTQHFYKNPLQYRLKSFEGSTDLSQHRWTVDTIEDFRLIKNLLQEVYRENEPFHMQDILRALTRHPEWNQINAHIKQKDVKATPGWG